MHNGSTNNKPHLSCSAKDIAMPQMPPLTYGSPGAEGCVYHKHDEETQVTKGTITTNTTQNQILVSQFGTADSNDRSMTKAACLCG